MAAAVCQRRKLSPEVAKLFTEGGPDEVVLPECTQLGQQEMIDALVPAATPRCAAIFSKSVTQKTVIYSAQLWTLSPGFAI